MQGISALPLELLASEIGVCSLALVSKLLSKTIVCWGLRSSAILLSASKFRENLSWPLTMGRIICSETSERNYDYALPYVPEEPGSRPQRGGSLKIVKSNISPTCCTKWRKNPLTLDVLKSRNAVPSDLAPPCIV